MVRIAKQVSQTIPNATSPTGWGIFPSTINLGNRFAKRRIRDVNVTLQGTASSQGAPVGLVATLTAPRPTT